MATTAAVLNVLVTANTKQATAALARTDAQLKKTAATAGAASTSMGRKVAQGAKYGALGIGIVGVASIKAAADFESAFAEVRKTVDATEPQFDRIEKGIRRMARTIPISANELAELAGQAGALGIKSKDLLRFTRIAADLGNTTDLSAEAAANALARLANIMGLKGTKAFSRMGSALVDLGNKGASTESEISALALRMAGVAKQVGLNTRSVLGWSAAMANVGIEAEAGGSAMSRAFIEMVSAAAEGGGKIAQFAKVAGVPLQRFNRMVKTDSSGAMETFVAGLGKVEKQGGNVFAVLDDLGLSEIRVRRTLLSLAGNSDKVSAALRNSEQGWKDNSALSEEARKRYKTFDSQVQVLKNNLIDMGISIGQKLLPPLKTAVKDITDVLSDENLTGEQKFDRLAQMASNAFAKVIPKLAEAAAVAGPKIAAALVKGFLNANIWGQLAIGAWLGHKLLAGGGAAKVGTSVGSRLGRLIPAGIKSGLKVGGAIGLGAYILSEIEDSTGTLVRALNSRIAAPVRRQMRQLSTHFTEMSSKQRDQMRHTIRMYERQGVISKQWADKLTRDLRLVDRAFEKPNPGKLTKKFGDMRVKTLRNVRWLDSGVQDGLGSIVDSTNRALKAFGVKKLIAKISGTLPSSAAGLAPLDRQVGGLIVGGSGTGDKVPALLEPGEVVINRKAVAAMGGPQKANRVNKVIPRFAKGGIAEPRLVGSSPQFNAMGQSGLHKTTAAARKYLKKHSGPGRNWASIDKFAKSFGLAISSTFRPGDSDSFHGMPIGGGRARATDYAGAAGGMFKFANRLGKTMGSKLEELIYTPLGWSIDSGNKVAPYAQADHYDHVHVAFQKGGVAKLRKGGIAPGVNKQFPQTSLSSPGFAFKPYVVAALAEHFGMPGITMMQISKGESAGHHPGIVSSDGGYGLWQMTPRTWGGGTTAGKAYQRLTGGDPKKFLNPVTNAKMAKVLWAGGSGKSNWYGTQYVTGWNQHWDGKYDITKGGAGASGGGGGGAAPAKPKLKLSKKQLKAIKKLKKHLKGLGLKKATQTKINNLTATYQQLEEYAGYASELEGPFRGRDQLSYLTEELSTLFKLRNLLVEVFEKLARQREKLAQQIADAEKRLEKLQKVKKPTKGQRRQMMALRERIPLMLATQKTLNTQLGGVVGDDGLLAIQGTGASMKKTHGALTAATAASQFGGQIFTVAKSILDLGANSSVDTAGGSASVDALKQLLREANLRTATSEAGFSVLKNTPWGGSFATGGIVPGPIGAPRIIEAHGGERISPVGEPVVEIRIANGMQWLEPFIDARVKRVTRGQSSRRPLPSRGGGV